MSVKTGTKKLISGNVTLRRFKMRDYFSMCKWFYSPVIIRYTTSQLPPTHWDIFKMVVGKVRRYYKKDYYSWAIVYNGKMSGFIELLNVPNANKYSVSYKLDTKINGRGIGTTSLSLVLEYMATQGVDAILAGCDEENIASRRVMEKSGMVESGSLETNPRIKYANGTEARKYIYKLDYKNKKNYN